jgi:hypothetical protein
MKANIVGATTDALGTALRRPGYSARAANPIRMSARDLSSAAPLDFSRDKPPYGLTLPIRLLTRTDGGGGMAALHHCA